jgi:hypothetical protein
MFLVADTQEVRHQKIRSFLPKEPAIAILLAAVDFEWTVRRAILALGTSPNSVIRKETFKHCHGEGAYKDAWKQEVQSRLGKGLPQVVPNWDFIRDKAFPLRHKVVHGLRGMPNPETTKDRVEAFLVASKAIADYAQVNGTSLFGKRLPVRQKPRK